MPMLGEHHWPANRFILVHSWACTISDQSRICTLCCRELKRARHIGSFESEEAAARAYDREAIKMLGADAGLNFRESRCAWV
jgi:hypothetical protein